MKLDRIDLNILTALQSDGRMTNADLADRVGLSPSPCLQRVKRLQAAGYIKFYAAQLELKKLGPSITVFLTLTLADHRTEHFTSFEIGMKKLREVQECHLISGGFDYMVKVVVRDLDHLQDLIQVMLEGKLGINRYSSYIVTKSLVQRNEVPLDLLFGELGKR